ncbi:tripeptidyl peptidase A [Multifurca ochricompacta]|uniref:tripeptidyl-peptidase II n=1 Tax=Multifurca ochricompacta TaxID=376703 RepID=A0AAD4QH47_9AGAM|nr:tripeptidyl peptidase A [Multifurca ochricompacta]
MRPHSLFHFLVTLSLSGATSAAPSPLKLRQSIASPRNWVDLGRAPPMHIIPLRIALPRPRFPELEKHLAEASDPFHERYGDHLSKEEVEEFLAPHASTIDAVQEWLNGHGIQEEACHRSPAGDWITVRVPVSQAESMLGTEFRVWKHAQDGDVLVRTTEYSLPAHLDGHVELIQPTTAFNRAKRQRTSFRFSPTLENTSLLPSDAKITVPGSGVTVDASCNKTITVSCLKQLYNAENYIPHAVNENAIGLTGYLEQFANFADLQQFYADQVPNAVNTSFDVVLINGGLNNQTLSEAGAEADLDIQFGLGISFPTPGTFYSTGGQPPFIPDADTPTDTNEPYTEWLDFILAQKHIPQTISTSYGDDEQTVPEDFARRVCQGFAVLGARGTSLMFSSGDGGVGDGNPDPATQTCFTNDGTNQTKFIPGFPASCPFVTAVGGTVHIPEVAVDFSGGGFSNFFPRPIWQDLAVTKFLKSLPKGTYAGLFNPNGRAIPDVSAQADFFRIFFQGRAVHIGGTSASSPSFAAFVALLNDARIAAGKSSLGFLNPLIYALNGNGFNDITAGNAPGCGTPGFNATAGWDPVTGWGTPDFGKLKNIALGY